MNDALTLEILASLQALLLILKQENALLEERIRIETESQELAIAA